MRISDERGARMRILILQDDFPPHSFGGAGMVVFNLAKELAKSHDIHVVTAVQNAKDIGAFKENGMTVHRIEAYYSNNFQAYKCLWNPSALREVKKVLSEFKPDVVHAHGVHAYLSYWSLVEAKRSGAKVVLTCHDVQSFN